MSNPEATRGDEAVFPHLHKSDDIPPGGVTGSLEATGRERAAIAGALDLVALEALRFDFKLHRSAPRRFKLKGHLTARVTQNCVVTLEPLESTIDAHVDIEFWPYEDVARLESEADQGETAVPVEGPEPLPEDGMIDVGQMAYEHLAAALDPYPRKPGVTFSGVQTGPPESAESGNKPFAELGRMMRRKDAR